MFRFENRDVIILPKDKALDILDSLLKKCKGDLLRSCTIITHLASQLDDFKYGPSEAPALRHIIGYYILSRLCGQPIDELLSLDELTGHEREVTRLLVGYIYFSETCAFNLYGNSCLYVCHEE